MHGGAAAIEEACLGEEPGAAVDTDDLGVACEAAQAGGKLRRGLFLDIEPGDHDQEVGLGGVCEGCGGDGEAAGEVYGCVLRGGEVPVEQGTPGLAVGGAQGVHGGSEGQHVGLIEGEEGDMHEIIRKLDSSFRIVRS